MRMRSPLPVAAVLAVTLASGALAQEWSLDTKGLGGPGASAQAKKGRQADAKPDQKGNAGKTENRQFGELEGWSPGKSPPKKKEDEKGSRFGGGGKAPVSMSPSGGMSVGMPF